MGWMLISNKVGVFLLLSFLFNILNIFSQRKIYVFSCNDSLPLSNAILFSKNKKIGQTDSFGKTIIEASVTDFKILKEDFLELDIKSIESDSLVFLKKDTIHNVEKDSKFGLFIKDKLDLFFTKETNFSFNENGVVRFKNIPNKKITEILVEVCDVFGVKNIKYKPFKISIYESDSVSNFMANKLYESEVLYKENNEKYFKYILNRSIQIKSKYIYVSFEILSIDYYVPNFIQSKVGTIAAVPSIKLIKDKNLFSFKFSTPCKSCESNVVFKKINKNFNIKVKYEN
ncbi:hypothetical protein FIA58_013410 [Flavobacterium jejuense]|uniref:Uncharacterized protein n=1 Tax=Flavobacterium jejuense TaxID=1544455 RepID=A0ABX0IS18_9FLAO|nr:hypothetical protein [Flavobacterium jejuense]NHN26677.1 hypothetical protein [Flavobacterium jejuense]